MAEYIDREALGIGKAKREAFNVPEYADGWNAAIEIIQNGPVALTDAHINAYRYAMYALADMVNQFGYSTTFRRQDAVCDGGLSALETAFSALEHCGCRVNSNGTISRKHLWAFMDELQTGKWIEWWPPIHMILTGEEKLFRCSACSANFAEIDGYRFCPHCGALMVGEEGAK